MHKFMLLSSGEGLLLMRMSCPGNPFTDKRTWHWRRQITVMIGDWQASYLLVAGSCIHSDLLTLKYPPLVRSQHVHLAAMTVVLPLARRQVYHTKDLSRATKIWISLLYQVNLRSMNASEIAEISHFPQNTGPQL